MKFVGGEFLRKKVIVEVKIHESLHKNIILKRKIKIEHPIFKSL